MDNAGKLPVINLTNDNDPNRNRIIRYFDLAKNDGRDTNHISQPNNLTDRSENCYSSIPVIDLTHDNEQVLSRIPVIDLTHDHDQFLNNGIPVIDLTDDHVQDIAKQRQSIDLTNDGAPIFNLADQYFDFSSNGDNYSNTSREIIDLTINNNHDFNTNTPVVDLTDDDNQDLINNRSVVDLNNNHHLDTNEPVVDLTYENDQFGNYRIPDVAMANNDAQDITRQFQNIDLTYDNVNDSILAIELAADNDQSIDRNITGVNLSCHRGYNNVRRSVTDLIRNDVDIIRNSDDVEIHNDEAVGFNNLPTSLQETVSENLAVKLRENVSENNIVKCNGTSNMNLMHVGTSCRMQPHYCRKETTFPNHSLTNNFEEKDSSPRRSEKIDHNTALDFMKPAHHPVPLRHSLGRSTVNTSKNIPIEYVEDYEGQFHALTVSSVIRRKKSKSSEVIFKENLPILKENLSSEPSTSKADIFSIDTFKEFFLKLWNFLFYWIFKIILRFVEFFDK